MGLLEETGPPHAHMEGPVLIQGNGSHLQGLSRGAPGTLAAEWAGLEVAVETPRRKPGASNPMHTGLHMRQGLE